MKSTLVSFLLIASGAAWAQATAPKTAGVAKVASAGLRITFEELKSLIESRNEKVKASGLAVEASSAREGSFGRSFLPDIDVSAAQESFQIGRRDRQSQPVYGIEARVNLFNGGRDRLRESVQTLTTQRRNFEHRGAVVTELSEARTIYWRIIYAQNLIALLKEARALNSENMAAADRRIRSGVATSTDRVEFQMKETELKLAMEQAELEHKNLLGELSLAIDAEAGKPIEVNGELEHRHEWEAELQHKHDEHEFLVKPAEILAQEQEASAAEVSRRWLPRVDVYAGWAQYNEREKEFSDSADRKESVVGVQLSMSLGEGLTGRREAAALRAEAEAAKLLASSGRKKNEVHINREFSELQFLHGKVHETEENIERAKTYDRLTKSEYGRGVKNSPDVLSASEKLFEAQKARLEILRDFQMSRSHVLSYLGR